jgi:ferredoxin-type protein NapH
MSNSQEITRKPFFLWKHLNKLRWITLSIVFTMLILLPALYVYQTYVAAHAYDLLSPSAQKFYDFMESLTKPFTHDPKEDLDAIKGSTWSGTFYGVQLSDPLSVLAQIAAGLNLYLPFILTALIPVVFTIIFGRFFCGWICPATFLYELNTNLAVLIHKAGLYTGMHRFNLRFKYLVLVIGIVISAVSGSVIISAIYPPAILGREMYYGIALGAFGGGMVFFLITLLFDLLVARRGFCRYICPGGALYAILGYFRIFRIQRIVENCNDCAKCNAVCEFGLDPLRDGFGLECNNCTACIAVCPTEALTFEIKIKDATYKGYGHLGLKYRKIQQESESEIDEGENINA